MVGDIMDHEPTGPLGHVVLFLGWSSTAHTSYNGYEFGGGSAPVYHVIPYPYFSWDNFAKDYLPYHYNNLVSDGFVPPPPASSGG